MSTGNPSRVASGIRVRHRADCPANLGHVCRCRPAFEAGVYSKRDGRKVRKTFDSLAAAKRWVTDQRKTRDDGRLRVPTRVTLAAAADRWDELAKAGGILTRSGDPYKPSVIRSYRQSLTLHVLPHLGTARLADIPRAEVQRMVAVWQGEGMGASCVQNAINALRAVYANADLLTDGAVPENPCRGLRLPARRGRRDRIASVDEAVALLAALPVADRALWATAFWAALRHGELKALAWEDVDLAAGVIDVRRSWDQQEGPVLPKSRAGVRRVPIIGRLHDALAEHRAQTGRTDGLVFGRSEQESFSSNGVNTRASRAWASAALQPIGLHEARHTAASFWIAAGLNLKTVSVYMGHSSVAFTLDRYGHLLPGNEVESVARIDAFLERADSAARLAYLD